MRMVLTVDGHQDPPRGLEPVTGRVLPLAVTWSSSHTQAAFPLLCLIVKTWEILAPAQTLEVSRD